VHAAPAESQRSQRLAKVTVGVPLQVPFAAVRVCPSRAVPLTDGAAVFAGGAATTTALGKLVAGALPPPFRPVTSTRIVLPTSAGTSA
jgi:hypothetical protein